MNPKITISIDAKNKAIVTLTGMVTVGSKVDIEISGLPDSIPNWREIDPYTGKSLRFRVVDCLGNDLVRYPLVKKGNETDGDTWDVDKDGVYANSVGCEVEFNTHKLRHAFNQVPFNEHMELGIILDSFVDSAEYAIGKIKIRQWSSASCDTPTVLPDWREILHGLKTDLESVNQSKAAAAAFAAQSENSATNAATSAFSASASESSAADYAAAANEAKEDAVEAMLKYPYIDEFGHWRVWSIVAGEWVDHGDAGAHYDDEVTETSANPVKSSGIWNWVKSLLPDWLNKNYAEPATTASVSAEEQRAKAIELDLRRRVENLGSSKADKTTTYTKSETDAKITANVENSVTSTSTTKALSANMGKELQDQIQNLKQRGRYLSIWDCTTGLAKTEPTVNPYEYKAGDYFIVGTVAEEGGTNYRPSGTSYDKTVPSTTVETGSPIVNDTYYYDGTSWTLLHAEQPEISWGSVVGKPDTFPPEAHTHTKSEITDFPTSMPPTAHSHASDSWFTTAINSKADEAKPSFSTITINGVDYTEWTLGTRSGKIMLSVDMGGISTEIAAFNPVTGVFESAPSQYRDTLRFDREAPVVGASPTLFDHVARESALSGKLDKTDVVAPAGSTAIDTSKAAQAESTRVALAGKANSSDIPSLSGHTFDLSTDAQFKNMCIAMARELGAVVTHTTDDTSTGAQVAQAYGITPTDATTFGELQTKAGMNDNDTLGNL